MPIIETLSQIFILTVPLVLSPFILYYIYSILYILEIAEGFPDYTNADAKFHDAAYDSFVTGKCFAIMSKHIGSQASPPVQDIISNSSLLNPFLNKLVTIEYSNVMECSFKSLCL